MRNGSFVVVFIALIFSGDAFAGDVQFDPQTIIQKRLVDSAIDRAETCVHSILLAYLYSGVRDRDLLVKMAAEKCGNDLAALLDRVNPKYSDKKTIHSALITYGYQQLDSILDHGE
jgi:hypothetical protein